ncbi:hypothetical protein B0T22DRAFT_368070 [Podospora appendiculata]|uniref:Uncharacterized protein n=1 Tax=Podospora appendiculata TaxID=314037 RepID=A0AAE0XJK3_9PEZI|nr:hypothetical protein B0T22DRAFT_368070 [Podospora appendiculata]
MKKSLWFLRWSCRSRSLSVSCGTCTSRTWSSQPRAAWEPLSHSSRTFHHKTGPIPPPQSTTSSRLENFRAATTAATTSTSANRLHPSSTSAWLGAGVHFRNIPTTRHSYRSYSQSSTLPAMAEVKWTGPVVRETFLKYFEERGHTIGT